MELDALIEMSHRYGADADFVLAGGGNTSYKTEDTLYIKGSGTRLASIDASGFVKMDRAKLAGIWNMKFSAEEKQRETEVLAAMMSARQAGEEAKRPSVETLLHDLFPQKLVLHVHPALVNGMMTVLTAICIVLTLKLIGIMLLMSLFTVPQMTAELFTSRLRPMMALAAAIGVVSATAGLFVSYFMNIPASATIVITQIIIYAVARNCCGKRQ